MRWNCPACQARIEHRLVDDVIFGKVYRCPVCRLNLMVDSVTEKLLPVTMTDRAVAKITIYQKPTCTTCKQVYTALKNSGVDFDAVDYYLDPIPRAKLIELLGKMGMKPHELLRTKEPLYGELKIGRRQLSDDQVIDLMVSHPDLIQRPIIEKGSRAILARPADRVKEIL